MAVKIWNDTIANHVFLTHDRSLTIYLHYLCVVFIRLITQEIYRSLRIQPFKWMMDNAIKDMIHLNSVSMALDQIYCLLII